MTERTATNGSKKSIQQLLVFQVDGIHLGVDTRQVASIRDPQSFGPEGSQVLKLHELIQFRNRSVTYRSPKILVIKNTTEPKTILVEAPDDIIFLNPSDIKPIPGLLKRLNHSNAIWGVYHKTAKTILIIDIFDLLAETLAAKKEVPL